MRIIKLLTNENPFDRYVVGPAFTLLLIFVVEILSRFEWYTPSLALPFAGLAVAAWAGGLWSNVVSAGLISIYALATSYDPSRSIQILIASFAVALACGYLKRKTREAVIQAERNQKAADLIKAANGNIKLLQRAHKRATELDLGWDVLKEKSRHEAASEIRGILASLLTLIEGWRHLAAERRRVIEDIDDDSGTVVTRYRVEKDKEQPIEDHEWSKFEEEDKRDE